MFSLSTARAACLAVALAFTASVAVWAAVPEHVAKVKETKSCEGCDLSDADLALLSAPEGNFGGANLTNANLYRADLRGAFLLGARLNGTYLVGADLTGAHTGPLAAAKTDTRTICPNGSRGPCR